ncbi:phage tail protein [Paenibacillus sp. KN14-4R]|uniref:phage tail protein n=1 Tax=Paenibacillus sp. KN14-4R TaxID=3445773 RepID=UPI003FA0C1AD
MKLTAILSLKDEYSAVLQQAAKNTKTFQKQVEQVERTMNRAFNKNRKINVDHQSAISALDKVTKKLKEIQETKVTVGVKENEKSSDKPSRFITQAKKDLKRLGEMYKSIQPVFKNSLIGKTVGKGIKLVIGIADEATKPFRRIISFAMKPLILTLKVADYATQGIMKVVGFAKQIGTMIAPAFIKIGDMIADTLKNAFNSGMELEQQQVVMDQVMKVNNPRMSGADSQKASQEYMQELRSNAVSKSFNSSDVIAAGTKALKETGGDAKQAMEMVKLAENMAALNPEKKLSDAMKALGDLKDGDVKGMKDFGFDIKDTKAKVAKGDLSKMKSDKGMGLAEMFDGGADKMAGTAKGMLGTITGGLKNNLQDMGLKMIESLKPALEAIIPLVSKMQPMFEKLGTSIGRGITTAIQFFKQNEGPINQFKATLLSIFTAVSQGFGKFITWLMPMLPPIVNFITGVIQKAIDVITPILPPIMNLFQSIIGWFVSNMPVFQNAIGAVFSAMAPVIDLVILSFSTLWDLWQKAWPTIQSIIESVWGVVQPIFGAIVDIIGIIIELGKRLWDEMLPVFEGIWSVLKPIVDGIGSFASWIGDKVSWFRKELQGDDKTPGKPHAAGLHTVPRDNYPALLHRNEAVLTAQEANQYRNGSKGSSVVINMNNPVVRDEGDFQKWSNLLRRELELAGLNMA